jgi:hypothetical protein
MGGVEPPTFRFSELTSPRSARLHPAQPHLCVRPRQTMTGGVAVTVAVKLMRVPVCACRHHVSTVPRQILSRRAKLMVHGNGYEIPRRRAGAPGQQLQVEARQGRPHQVVLPVREAHRSCNPGQGRLSGRRRRHDHQARLPPGGLASVTVPSGTRAVPWKVGRRSRSG